MSLLAAVTYDPATAVTLSCSAGLAMTAMDTTNLRLGFVAPPSGQVMVRLRGTLTSPSSTVPAIHLGVLEGTTVRGRLTPMGPSSYNGTGSSFQMPVEAMFVITGLTGGASLTWDAAYAVEYPYSGAAIKYGGPNDATAGTAWGAFCFEVWST